MHPVSRRSIILLLVLGALLCAAARPDAADFLGLLIPLLLAPAAAYFHKDLAPRLDRLRTLRPTPVAWLVFALSLAYLIAFALWKNFDLAPRLHDEYSYLLQIRMLSRGRLWLPAHELADHFETFHVLVRPVYASLYFPGTALAYLPTAWLNLPSFLMPAIVASAAAAMLFRIVTHFLADTLAGLCAALLVLALPDFRTSALSVMPQPPTLLLALTCVWLYLRWHAAPSLPRAALIGLAAGWLCITRPIDAICLLLPILIAALLDIRRKPRLALTHLPLAAGCALPFLLLQLYFNHGVTGRWMTTPHEYYSRTDLPQMVYGFRPYDPAARPASSLRQKHDYYQQWMVPVIKEHSVARIPASWLHWKLPTTLRVTLASPFLAILLPLGLLALRDRRWVLLAILPAYALLYTPFPYLLEHYALLAAPAAIFAVLAGAALLATRHPVLRVAFPCFLIATALAGLTTLIGKDPKMDSPLLRHLEHLEATQIRSPAIVLIRYAPESSVHVEPVYNVDTANPDDAKVIRAHDLGPDRNVQLFRYYAARQPHRNVYRFDRATGTLTPLGNVRDLAAP